MQQNYKMLPQKNVASLQSPLRLLSVFVVHLLLTHTCRGQSQLFGPSQPIVANIGDDIILPCYLDPVKDVSAMTLEWTRPDLRPEFVNVRRDGEDLIFARNPSFKGRTSLFTDELKKGNMSLKLSKVKPSDMGRYTCFIPKLNKASVIKLVVAAASSPVINLAGIDRNKGGVVLYCESAGWYPEPEVLWLDGEGKLLSAGPTETVRGPDDLYTVSSRVTVEKRHNNSFTCRVHQKDTNHTRETHITVPDDFFVVQSSSASTITGLAVGLAVSLAVCLLLILLLVSFVCKQRQKINKTKGSPGDEKVKIKKKQTKKSGDQSVTEEKEGEQLMTGQTVEMRDLNNEDREKTKHSNLEGNEAASSRSSCFSSSSLNPFKRLRDEQRRREDAEQEVEDLNKQLESISEELKTTTEERNQSKLQVVQLSDELQQLQQEKQRREEELRKEKQKREKELRDELESIKKTQMDQLSADKKNLQEEKRKRDKELEEKNREVYQLSAHNKKLHQEKQRREEELKNKKKELEDKEKELKNQLKSKDAVIIQLKKDSMESIQQEKQRAEEAERELKQTINEQLVKMFHEEKTKMEEAERKTTDGSNQPQRPQSVVPHQSLTTGPVVVVVEVNQKDKYIRLRNMSTQDQKLEGWTLYVQFENKENNTCTFKSSHKLKAGDTVTMRDSYSCRHPFDLWKVLSSWSSNKLLLTALFCETGKIQHLFLS